jgi:uncharacterized protein (DUF1330 family)
MAKAYWIGRVDVHNDEGYKPYAAANPGIFRKYGGRFVVRAGKFARISGQHQGATAAFHRRSHYRRRLRRPAAIRAPNFLSRPRFSWRSRFRHDHRRRSHRLQSASSCAVPSSPACLPVARRYSRAVRVACRRRPRTIAACTRCNRCDCGRSLRRKRHDHIGFRGDTSWLVPRGTAKRRRRCFDARRACQSFEYGGACAYPPRLRILRLAV